MRILFICLASIIALEIGIYFYSDYLTTNLDIFYSLCSRYSARLSFALLIVMGIWLSYNGIVSIYKVPQHRILLKSGLIAFMLNHLIHFYFLAKNFEVNHLDLGSKIISFGTIGYIILVLIPLYVWKKRKLNKRTGLIIYGFVMLMIGICVFTYSTRFSSDIPIPPPDFFFITAIIAGISIIVWLGYRVFSDFEHNVF